MGIRLYICWCYVTYMGAYNWTCSGTNYTQKSEIFMAKGYELNTYNRCVANKIVNGKNLPFCGMWMTTNCHIWK